MPWGQGSGSALNRHTRSMLRPLAITLSSMLLLGFVAPPANAQQTKTIVYVLDDVWLNPDIVNPWGLSRTQMTGTFSWTYTVVRV